MVWTRFMDMSSGGGRKEGFSKIYIEAPESEASAIFFSRFGHSPYRTSCTCCGPDYSADESETLDQATAYDRGRAWEGDGYVERPQVGRSFADAYVPLDEYVAGGVDVNGRNLVSGEKEKVTFIYEADIKPEDRRGEVPVHGYVWGE